ncbi:UNVERIFIED_CONTAM: hypothetical protein FKN15_001245 [Acipenser sinensis]
MDVRTAQVSPWDMESPSDALYQASMAVHMRPMLSWTSDKSSSTSKLLCKYLLHYWVIHPLLEPNPFLCGIKNGVGMNTH